MPECTAPGRNATPIAIVGLACRFPDADDPLALFESALAGRRAFRRLPPGRLGAFTDPDAGHDPGRPGTASGAAPRAAVLEGWQFDRAGFGVPERTYLAADPAHWLALETAGRALADAGFPGGQGLARDRAGVIIGNTLTGEVSRAAALRTRWPFVRAVLTDGAGRRGRTARPSGPGRWARPRPPLPPCPRSAARPWRAASPARSPTGSAAISDSAAAARRWTPRTPRPCSRWPAPPPCSPRASWTSSWPAGWTSAWTPSSSARWPRRACSPPARCGSMTPARPDSCPGKGAGCWP